MVDLSAIFWMILQEIVFIVRLEWELRHKITKILTIDLAVLALPGLPLAETW